MYKKVLLITYILIVSGCAGKKDFTQGVSEEDKKLISSYDDELLYKQFDIRITKNGFYPDCNININGTVLDKHCTYLKKVADFSKVKKFNLRKFMQIINSKNLKQERINRLAVQKKYPSFEISKFDSKDITILSSKNSSLYQKQKAFVHNQPIYIRKINNPSEELQKIAVSGSPNVISDIKNPTDTIWNLAESKCNQKKGRAWYGRAELCRQARPYTPSPKYSNSSSTSSSGGSNSGGGHYEIQTVYVPGGNGRTAQTGVWVND